MSDGKPTQVERDRAARLGRLAAKHGRALGSSCPYDANGTPRARALAVVFVREWHAAGGKLDALDYGDGKPTATRTRATSPTSGGRHRAGRSYGHLGYPG